MTRDEFQETLAEISAYFGEKTFQPRMSGLLWSILGPLSKGEGRRIIEQLTETCTRPPTPAQVRQVALPFTRKNDEEKKRGRISALDPCHVCGGSGMMLALLKESPVYEYSFACGHCDAAQVRGYQRLPVWTDASSNTCAKVSLKPESHSSAAEIRNAEFAKRHPPKPKRGTYEALQDMRGREAVDRVPPPGADDGRAHQPLPVVLQGEAGGVLPGEPEADPGALPEGFDDCPF